jgi:putative membrane protein
MAQPSLKSPLPKQGLLEDFKQIVRGLLIGSADIVPGVSGGTVALILGIYERLVTAISHVDAKFFRELRAGQWRAAAEHLDLRFLIALAAGIGTGILCLASTMNYLLTNDATRQFTLAAFFGLVFASSVFVAKMIRTRGRFDRVVLTLLGIAGGAFAFWLTGLSELEGSTHPLYVFFTGSVAICAMILPGISGAFIMVIFGMYVTITDILKRLPKFDIAFEDIQTLVIFVMGCAISLIMFSKFLRWLLARHEPQTMAVLCGFMLGSLRKIWPFQRDVTLEHLTHVGLSPEKVAEIQANPSLIDQLPMKHRAFESFLPEAFSANVGWTIAVAAIAFVAIFVLEWASAEKEVLRAEDHEPGK